MSSLPRSLRAALLALALALPAAAQDFTALARLDPARSAVTDLAEGLSVVLALSQPVPWRAFTLADPPRLVLDFREVDWRAADAAALLRTTRVLGLRTGAFRPGWSRLVADLAGPFVIARAGMQTAADGAGTAEVRVDLVPAAEEVFRARSGAPADALWPGKAGSDEGAAAPAALGDGPLTVVLDPGHGGIDPGAERDGLREADLMLTFAFELREALIRAAGYRVVLTREADEFVPLDRRISIARAAGADLFLSLHADAVAEGEARGATVYTLSETASDEASAALAERHDRADLLAGVDLSDQDDAIATVLMELARLDTQPRSEALADAVVEGLRATVGGLHKRPRLAAGFSVLRAPDIPSVLIELGFITSDADRARLTSPDWRARAAAGIVAAVAAWAAEDAARSALLRQ
jgi:N-acetylmuramoyl-L-alanine amidase